MNNTLKIAIEIKDDAAYTLGAGEATNLRQKSNQFKAEARDTNKKMRNYPGYKSILLIRTRIALFESALKYILEGIDELQLSSDGEVVGERKKNEYLSASSTEEIGCYVFPHNGLLRYFKNPRAEDGRVMSQTDVAKIFGFHVQGLQGSW